MRESREEWATRMATASVAAGEAEYGGAVIHNPQAKHHVIVPESAIWPYLANGYQRSELTPQSLLAAGWAALAESERNDLVVLEIDQDQHEALNRPDRRYAVSFTCNKYITNIEPRTYEILEEDGALCVVANAELDVLPGAIEKSELHPTALDAARAAAAEVRSQIELHKVAIANLEAFLGKHL